MTNYLKKYFAFTLAETLIVMGIIGIVSALTLPNLNSSTGEKEKIAKVKKIYRDLDDALGRAQAVYGPIDEWTLNDTTMVSQTTRVGDRLTEFMKISKNCGVQGVSQGCCSRNTIKIAMGGTGSYNICTDTDYSFITADGTGILLQSNTIYIDIDGPSKGNLQFGKDVFRFLFNNNTLVPERQNNVTAYITEIFGTGHSTSGWVIDYDNMDYLKLNSDKKCPNGSVMNDTNPRCK